MNTPNEKKPKTEFAACPVQSSEATAKPPESALVYDPETGILTVVYNTETPAATETLTDATETENQAPPESALVLHVFDPVTGTLKCVPAPATGTPSATGKSNFDPITGKITFFGKRLD